MNKTTKGALAAGTASVLLLGGAGTLAYWSADGTAEGTTIVSGHLMLTAETCGGWMLDGETTEYDPLVNMIVPGDTLTQVCTFTVDAAGDHLAANFDVVLPTYGATNDLTAAVDLAATYQIDGGEPVAGNDVAVVDDDVVSATITATFDSTTTGAADLTAVLNDVTVTVTQTHDAPAVI